jgi:hypothetical protein
VGELYISHEVGWFVGWLVGWLVREMDDWRLVVGWMVDGRGWFF